MKKKYNFEINFSNQTVSIEVSPLIFPTPVILHAAYHFIDDAKVIVDEVNDKKIAAILIPNKKLEESELEELAYEFNIQLISSFVEGVESEKNVGIRETIMKAALLPQVLQAEKPLDPKLKREDSSSLPGHPKT
jgi:His-Xaa-Ser system protein HxsD